MSSQMTSRERWRATLRSEQVDRLAFWPKIDGAYPRHQIEPYRSMKPRDMIVHLGGDLHIGGPSGVRSHRARTSMSVEQQGDLRVTKFTTRNGELTYIEGFSADSWSHHPVKFPVETVEDVRTLTEFFADDQPEPDPEQLAASKTMFDEIGENGICVTDIGISPLMDWLQHLAGVQNGTYLLHDEPEAVGALFEEMHRVILRRSEIVAEHHPFDVVYSVENTSTTLMSPDMFRKWCAPYLTEYGRILTDAGKIHVLHMCGKLKALLPDIGALPAHANEAFTSAPVGDTSLLDGRIGMPDRCLIGGTNAALWLEPADTIIETIERDLAQLPHRRGLAITSAGVMPPACKPETIRKVRDWVVSQAA